MSRLLRLPFSFWFAYHDLFDRRARRSSLVIVISLFFITAIITAGSGLIWGYQHAQYEYMRNHGGFYVAAGSPSVVNEVTSDLLTRLRDNLKKNVTVARARPAPFHRDEHEWLLEGRSEQEWLGIEGRTVANDDPLLNSLLDPKWLQVGNSDFDMHRRDGIFVTPNFLKRIDYAQNGVPNHVRLMTTEGKDEPICVLGVSRYPLPGDFDYVVPESYYEAFLALQHPQRHKSVLTGAIHETCCTEDFLDQFSRRFVDELKSWDVSPAIRADETDAQEPCWVLNVDINSKKDELSSTAWEQIVAERLPALIVQMGGRLDVAAFSQWNPRGRPKAETLVPDAYDQLVVYVDEPEHLKPVAFQIATLERGHDNATAQGSLYVNEDLIKQADQIGSKTRDAEVLLLVVGGVVVFVACANMFTILWMRAQQQIAEIGMLKTMGLDYHRLRRLYVVEGLIVWLLGAVPGFLTGIGVGYAFAVDLADRYQAPFAFRLPGASPVFITLALSGLLCTLIMVFATSKARRTSAYLCLFDNL